jgi:tRNA nucleotidyltransferase (CCA-adding enzyme)
MESAQLCGRAIIRVPGGPAHMSEDEASLDEDSESTNPDESSQADLPAEATVYTVGGAVRDELLGKDPDDEDYVMVGVSESTMDELFKRVHVGERAHPVWLDVDSIIHPRDPGDEAAEIALARKEKSTGPKYSDFEYTTDNVSIDDDLNRRDLTINAIAKGDSGYIDPHGGRDDLANNIARHVSEQFSDDPIRVLRLARFTARFNLRVAPDTLRIARETAPKLQHEPVERIRDELLKMLYQTGAEGSPRRFFDTLRDCNALRYSYPLLRWAIHTPTDAQHHQEGDLYSHTMLVLEQANRLAPDDEAVKLAALTHDLGKIKQQQLNTDHHAFDDFVIWWLGLKLSNSNEQIIRDAITDHMRIHTFADDGSMNLGTKFKFVDQYTGDRHGLNFRQLIQLGHADSKGRIPQNKFDQQAFYDDFDKIQNAFNMVDGNLIIDHFDIDPTSTDDAHPHPGEQIKHLLHETRINCYTNSRTVINGQLFKLGDTVNISRDSTLLPQFTGRITSIDNNIGTSQSPEITVQLECSSKCTVDAANCQSISKLTFEYDGITFNSKQHIEAYKQHVE